MDDSQKTLERVFRENSGRVLANLIAKFGDFDLAEDALQDAYVAAMEHWPEDGVPSNPAGWLTVTARNKAIDRLRRADTRDRKIELIESEAPVTPASTKDLDLMGPIPDERLKLIFTCCHPALSLEAQVALTLRTLGGLTTKEIARAFLVPVPTLAQRIVRAKRKIRETKIPFRVPPAHLLSERLQAVFSVLYLVFNEGYATSAGDTLVREELCGEAIRLARTLVRLLEKEGLKTELPEAVGLLALMCLHHSRRRARVSPDGELVLLQDQDRSLWDDELIEDGISALDRALGMAEPGPYQIQAAIAALHAKADRAEDTDWAQIAALYGVLIEMNPSPVIALNRAVAVAMAEGLQRGLELIDEVEDEGELEEYVPFHAARADLLRRAGRLNEAKRDYQRAQKLSENEVEQKYFQTRLAELAEATDDA